MKGIKASAAFGTKFPTTFGRKERAGPAEIGRCDDEREDIEGAKKTLL